MRSKILPDNVHFWRGKHWTMIARLNQRRGGGIKKVKSVMRIITAFNERKERGLLTPRNVTAAAQALMGVAAEITDEVIWRMEQGSMPHESWNDHYVDCLKHFWGRIPRELRHEIIHQSKNEWDFRPEKK